MKKKIFLTGADGFIGSHLVEGLVAAGYKVKALVYYNQDNQIGSLKYINKNILNEVEVVFGDIRDYNLLKKYVKNDCFAVINLAALIGIPYSYDAPHSYFKTNVEGTLNILNIVNELNIERFIQTSTSEVYGNSKIFPIKETFNNYANSPYAASKIAADQLCNSYFASYNTPVSIIRPFNTYGPRQSSRAIIPTVINQLLNKNFKINIGNISTYRDFNYVTDTVNGFIKLLESNQSVFGETFNIGSNFKISIKDISYMIADILGVKIKFNIIKKRIRPKKSEIYCLLADSSKSKKILNWIPEFKKKQGLKEGLKMTVEWFSKNKSFLDYKGEVYVK